MKSWAKFLLLFMAGVACDRLLKGYVKSNLRLYQIQPLLPKFLALTRIHNLDGIFGAPVVENASPVLVLGMVAVGVGIVILRSPFSKTGGSMASFGLFVAGVVSNALDSIRFGRVVDTFALYFQRRWYPFNSADAFIWIGLTLLTAHVLLTERKRHSARTTQASQEKFA